VSNYQGNCMKTSMAIAVAAMFASGTAFGQSVQPQTSKAPVKVAQQQVAQTGGGMAMGAGEATGVAGTSLSATGIVAVAAGTAVVVGASGSTSTTNH